MKKLIIIGASFLQVPLIKKAREMGLETHVFAWQEGAVGKDIADFFYPISITEMDLILDKSRELKPSGIISIASDLAMITVNYIADKLGITGNTMHCTELTTNKYLMRQALDSSDLPCPKYYRLTENSSLNNIEDLKFPVIIKPTDRSGSRGVTKVIDAKNMGSAKKAAFIESINKEIIIEEFIEGREISVEMISWKGDHHFITCTDKVTSGVPHFVETEQHQPAQLSIEMVKKVVAIVKKALNALNVLNGASHSEIIITPDNAVYIVEIGARMGGDHIGAKLVELSTGYDFVKSVINVALGITPTITLTKNHFSGICFITTKPGKVSEIVDNTDLYPEIIEKEILVTLSDDIKVLKESADRIGYYLYKSKNNKFSSQIVEPLIVKTI